MKSDKPNLFKVFKWTTYPTVTPGSTAHPTIGGIDLTVSAYSKHKALAEQAALCLRNSGQPAGGRHQGRPAAHPQVALPEPDAPTSWRSTPSIRTSSSS